MKNRKWGLVLAGGGGKGAYQVGVIKALQEQGWLSSITALSGSSVGALNAAMVALEDVAHMEKIWRGIRPEQLLDMSLWSKSLIEELQNKYTEIRKFMQAQSINEYLATAKSEGMFERDGLIKLIETQVDLEKIRNSKRKIYATLTRQEECLPVAEYHLLNGKSNQEIIDLLMASSALPIVYDVVTINGVQYRDGGLADNVPLKPLLEDGMENLIVVRLSPGELFFTKSLPGVGHILEIRPSRDLGDFVSGTINFKHESILYRIALGYYDTLRILKEQELVNAGTPTDPMDFKIQMLENHNRALSENKRNLLLEDVNRHMEEFKRYENYYNKLL